MKLEVNERPKGATRNGLNIIGKNSIFCLDQSLNSLETFTARLAIERGRQESFSARLAIERGRQETFSARLESFSACLAIESPRLENVNILLMLCK